MDKYHNIEEIKFKDEHLSIKVDGQEYIFEVAKISKKLANASQIEKEKYQISPSGYGIHWQLIDEDLSVDGLLGIKHSHIPEKKPDSVKSKTGKKGAKVK